MFTWLPFDLHRKEWLVGWMDLRSIQESLTQTWSGKFGISQHNSVAAVFRRRRRRMQFLMYQDLSRSRHHQHCPHCRQEFLRERFTLAKNTEVITIFTPPSPLLNYWARLLTLESFWPSPPLQKITSNGEQHTQFFPGRWDLDPWKNCRTCSLL